MKKIDINWDELFQLHYKTNVRKYIYLKRLARATPRGTLQRIIDSRVFPRDWRTEEEQLRAAQEKLGFKDYDFYPPALLRRMGIEVKRGRYERKRKPYGRRK